MAVVAMSALDIAVLVVVLGGVFVIGIFISWRARDAADSSDFFLGGRDMAWWAIGGSLFASNIGCGARATRARPSRARARAYSWTPHQRAAAHRTQDRAFHWWVAAWRIHGARCSRQSPSHLRAGTFETAQAPPPCNADDRADR